LAAVLPVLSLLVLGSWILGAVALQEFALALLVGMALGAYSSIYIATPLLGILKTRETKFAPMANELHLGEEMSRIANSGKKPSRVVSADSSESGTTETVTREAASVAAVLSHPPRPRKKQRR
jgi:preprotein translocase subunit SecF